MKRLGLLVLVMVLAAGYAWASGYVMEQEAGGMNVKLVFEEDHIHMGENHVALKLTDSKGNEIEDAKVKIEYGMPPMPNMPPMNYKARTRRMHGSYEAMINLAMNGHWYLDVKVLRPGNELVNARFEFNIQDERHELDHDHGHDHGHEKGHRETEHKGGHAH